MSLSVALKKPVLLQIRQRILYHYYGKNKFEFVRKLALQNDWISLSVR